MNVVPNTSPKIRALADAGGKLEIHFDGHRLPTLAAALGTMPDGSHILTVQFALSAIELGQAPVRPVPALIAHGGFDCTAPLIAHAVDP